MAAATKGKKHTNTSYYNTEGMSPELREVYEKGMETNPLTGLPRWMTELTPGHNYFIQTCTKDWVGCLLAVTGPYTVVLGPNPNQTGSEAAWSAESGRLNTFIREGRAEGMEIELVNVVCAQWVDWIPWPHKLFEQSV